MQHGFNGLRARRFPAGRLALTVVIAGLCLWLLRARLDATTLSDLPGAIADISPAQWGLAGLATCISFLALGRYDVVIHRHFGTGSTPRRAGIVGAASIALGQVLGAGVFVGALVRWRMLPELDPLKAARISVTVAVWFFVGLLGALCLALAFGSLDRIPGLAALGAAALLCLIAATCLLRPTFSILGHRVRLLSLPALGSILCLTLIDTAAAAAALWILMPAAFDGGFALLFAVYLVALAAALVSGTPGGVGPFELTLFALLPAWPEGDLMVGIVAFRLVYYALPCAVAMAVICTPFRQMTAAPTALAPMSEAPLIAAQRSELGVCRQNGAKTLSVGQTMLGVAATPQTQTVLFDPFRGDIRVALPQLRALARQTNRIPFIYKASARQAALCRRSGLRALHIADEALVFPPRFSTDGSAFRQLRRKLRNAAKQRVEIRAAQHLPLSQMRAIDAEWQAKCGSARGFSMGRFCPDYLRHQNLYLAYQDNELVAFASFHVSDHEWCLDLMRSQQDAPDGVMHALVHTAITDAAADGIARLSLAALPPEKETRSMICKPLILMDNPGLSRFKSCFAPHRAPLYALAPGWIAMALALVDVALAIHRPNTNNIHVRHEDYEFASLTQT